jgi:uncharacterized membrane protein YdjX (TVP38/TMEM64 family)
MSDATGRQRKLRLLAGLAIVTVVLGFAIYMLSPYWSVFTNPEQVQALVLAAGPWGPVVFIALQILQVFFAPIPGQITGLAGGYLFGAFWGTTYTMIGATIGFTLIFNLVRLLGRPIVEYFVSDAILAKFDYLIKAKGPFVFFLIFLLPAFPDDLICYIAGLTTIRIRTLILISILGRFPGYLVLSIAGAGAAQANVQLVAVVVSALMFVSGVAFWQRARLEKWVKRLSHQQAP